MDLKIKDIVELLNVNEKTVYRWIKDKKIPCYKINHQYRFNRAEINEWILLNKIEVSSSHFFENISKISIAQLIESNGIVETISGTNITQVLKNAVDKIKTPEDLSKEEITSALLSREELMQTAIGRGIAIPHPRNPIITNPKFASVSVCYLETPLDFSALDNQDVHTLFILLSASPKMHLEILSRISFLCQKDEFLNMLRNRASKEEVIKFIDTEESKWNKKENN
ncbi:PTS sugar transporter subunit IIA [Melioribacter sp. OK-6-Me]|uniref:PTS sugar transporter subunit IIA n=1 Tax=unclassified Melioribacter TaxID=2627329 RepID=UPI003ED8E8B1